MIKTIRKAGLCLLMLIPTLVFAQQSGTVKGRIQTNNNKNAGYVSVSLTPGKMGITSDEDGSYTFNKVKPGKYTIKVSAVGLETISKEIIVKAGETTVVNFKLQTSSGELEEVIVSGTKNKYRAARTSNSLRLDQPLIEIPQNIQVITSGTLQDQQVTTMSDGVLRNVSGATRLEHWGEIYTRVNMRGTRASAFRNGFNVTSDWGPLNEDMSFVDHIEFVKGPSGFMMSSGEPSGLYNVVTKKPTGRDFNGEATVTLGSYDMYRAALDLDGRADKKGKLLYRLNVMGQNKRSFRPFEFNDRYIVAPVLTYKFSEKTSITAEYTYQRVKMSDLGSAYVFATEDYAVLPRKFTFSNPGIKPSVVNDHSALLNFQHQFNDKWKFTAQGSYFNNKQLSSDIWPAAINADGTAIRSLYSFDALLQYGFAQGFVNGEFKTGTVRHRLLGGIDYGKKRGWFDWSQTFNLDTPENPFNVHNPNYGTPALGIPSFDRSRAIKDRAGSLTYEQYTGIYLQDELGFLDNRLRLTLAGRYTFLNQGLEPDRLNAKKFSPRIGLSANIDASTSVYALYDQSFLPQSGNIEGGGTAKPVTGNNLEVGFKRDWFEGRWNSTLSVYRILRDNQLMASPNSTPAVPLYIQSGQSRAQGIELDIRGEIIPGLNLVANYALTDYEITKPIDEYGVVIPKGTKIAGYAKHNANAWLSYKVQQGSLKGTGISAGFNFQADRSTWTWAASTQRDLPNYFRLDGGLFWENSRFRATGNVFNILNKYLYSGAAYGTYYYWQSEAPTNFRLSLSYRF